MFWFWEDPFKRPPISEPVQTSLISAESLSGGSGPASAEGSLTFALIGASMRDPLRVPFKGSF